MDKIFLHGMKINTLIGVYDWERLQPQTILVDLDITLPPRAHDDDNIISTIHYGDVCERLRAELAQREFQLIERLAQHIADYILQQFNTQTVRVRVIKPGILADVREVGVEIKRTHPSLLSDSHHAQ